MSAELSPRTQLVLEIVVREYVAGAVPVSSKRVAGRYALGISPATIRNEMALLEELGYLTHPHTSAGRIPTVGGYRYFVQHLMGLSELSHQEQAQIERELERARRALDLEQCMRLAASLMARTTGVASWVTAPRAHRPRLRHVELVRLDRRRALLILILEQGRILEEVLHLPRESSPEELEALSQGLTRELAWKGAQEIGVRPAPEEALAAAVVARVVTALQAAEAEEVPQVYHDGLSHFLSQPEFTHVEQARRLLELWEKGEVLSYVSGRTRARPEVQVIIAGEGRWDPLRDYSLVFARYGSRSQASGTVGVMGPLRMPYGKAVSAVRFTRRLLSERVAELYR